MEDSSDIILYQNSGKGFLISTAHLTDKSLH